jgi:hypothetical protein
VAAIGLVPWVQIILMWSLSMSGSLNLKSFANGCGKPPIGFAHGIMR